MFVYIIFETFAKIYKPEISTPVRSDYAMSQVRTLAAVSRSYYVLKLTTFDQRAPCSYTILHLVNKSHQYLHVIGKEYEIMLFCRQRHN